MVVEPERLHTYDDYVAFPDDGIRREILSGEVYELPGPSVRHQRLVGQVYYLLRTYLEREGRGEAFLSPIDVLLGEHDIVQPDVVYVAGDRASIITQSYIDGAPTIVVEVVSDTGHDRVRKRALYAKAGVIEYWIVDPDSDRIEVHRLHAGSYAKPKILEAGDTLTTDLLPGFTVDVAALLDR